VGRILWPTLIIGAVALGLVVSASGTATRNQIEYLARIEEQAGELSKGSAAVRQVIVDLPIIARTDFETAIAAVEEDLSAARALAEEEAPTASVVPIRSMYRQAVESWSDGIEGFKTAILTAADHPDDPTAIDLMASALAQLRAGDAIYADLLAEVAREDVPDPLTPLPAVVMLPEEGGLVSLSLGYVEAARSEMNTLALRPGLGVSQIVANPEWQVDATDQVALPTTEQVVFSVVMVNAGNVASPPTSVTVTLLGGPELVTVVEELAPLEPGQMRTLLIDPLAVEPGGLYEVAASIENTAEDTNLEDNQLIVQFTVNED
jgi:hypothetical protein